VGRETVIAETWDRYRGWANRSRELQAAGKRNKRIALVSAALAAVFGAVATLYPNQTTLGRGLALMAAAAAAVAAILGREMLSPGDEKIWIQARATAEAIKSECFLAAARVPPYDAPDARDRLAAQIDALEEEPLNAGVNPLLDPAAEDKRRAPEPDAAAPLTTGLYRTIRLQDQRDFYSRRAKEHLKAVKQLRLFSIGAAIVAALLGIAAGAGQPWLAPWIGTLTTIASAITAWGLIDRRSYLVVSYEAMAHRLSVLDGRAATMPLPNLVGAGEELLRTEHTAWAQRMSEPTRPAAAAPGSVPPTGPEGAPPVPPI
jgi:hypothetical protein